MAGEDKLPSDSILFFDKIIVRLRSMAAGPRSHHLAAVPPRQPKNKARPSTLAKDAAAAAAAAEPEDVIETNDDEHVMVSKESLTFDAENCKQIGEGKRKLDKDDDANIYKTKKVHVTSTPVPCILEANQSSSASTSSKVAETSVSASSSGHGAAMDPTVNTEHVSNEAENRALACSSAKQAPSALHFDLNLPPPEEF